MATINLQFSQVAFEAGQTLTGAVLINVTNANVKGKSLRVTLKGVEKTTIHYQKTEYETKDWSYDGFESSYDV